MVEGILTQRIFAISNPNRIKIYQMCLKERLNITEISKRLKLSYKSTLNNIEILENAELIKRVKETTNKAQESFIESIQLNSEHIIDRTIKQIIKEQTEK